MQYLKTMDSKGLEASGNPIKQKDVEKMKLVNKKLRVSHYAQVPCKPFHVNVLDEYEAKKIIDVLAQQHLFLSDNKIIPDYANVIMLSMWEEELDPDPDNGEKWTDYFNEEECMCWKEFENKYSTKLANGRLTQRSQRC